MPVPQDLLFIRAEQKLVVTWENGTTSDLPISYLRSWCPCAGCQGHSGKIEQRKVQDTIEALEMEEVGSYALKIKYSDGHDAGIYTWEWLFKLSSCYPPRGYKQGSYFAGEFSAPDIPDPSTDEPQEKQRPRLKVLN